MKKENLEEDNKTTGNEIELPCQKCDVETYHKVVKSIYRRSDTDWGIYWNDHQIVMCLGCRNLSFRKNWGSDDIIDQDENGDFVYDENEELFPNRVPGRKEIKHFYELPTQVRKVYQETHRAISSNQPILAGIGIRAIVETVCTEKKAKGYTLEERIDALVKLGVLTKDGASILHQTRFYGNNAAHDAIVISPEKLGILMDIAENLLKNVYVLPNQALKLKNKAIKDIDIS
jgi:hypothetical protein